MDWFVGVLEGDFNEDPSTSQIIVGAVIGAIPVVSQGMSIRDVIANICKLTKKSDDTWLWVALVLALLPFIPFVGGPLKGALSMMLKALRKGGKYADEALETMLAVIRGAGKGDPVRFLKNLPWEDYTQQVLKHFNDIVMAMRHSLRDVYQNWVIRRIASEAWLQRLKFIDAELERLMQLGADQIPKAMRTLRNEVDTLLAKAKPEIAKGQSGAQTVIKNSERPLLRVQYEVRDKMLHDDVAKLRGAGKSDKEIAEFAVQARKDLQAATRAESDPQLLKVIQGDRNELKYGHPDGPQMTRNEQTGMWDYKESKFNINTKKIERVTRSKTDKEVTEGALRSGGDDIPWDKTLEYTRAKDAGNLEKSERILKEIDRIVNNGK